MVSDDRDCSMMIMMMSVLVILKEWSSERNYNRVLVTLEERVIVEESVSDIRKVD